MTERYWLETLGCPKNQVDSDKLAGTLVAEGMVEAVKLVAAKEGILLDPVYSGKGMAGLIDLVRAGEIAKDSTVLYAHLGGQPALNAYSALFKTS